MSAKLQTRQFFTAGQVANLCGASASLVRLWLKQGQLQSVRLPYSQHRRVPRAALAEFAAAHGMGPVLEALQAGARQDYLVQRALAGAAWLTTADAGKLLNVGYKTVQKWCNLGVLPSHRIPGNKRIGERRISRENLLRFAEEHGLAVAPSRCQPRALLVGFAPAPARAVTAALPGGWVVDRAANVVAAALAWARHKPGAVLVSDTVGGVPTRELAEALAAERPAPVLLAVRPEDRRPGYLGVTGLVELPAGATPAELAAALEKVTGGERC